MGLYNAASQRPGITSVVALCVIVVCVSVTFFHPFRFLMRRGPARFADTKICYFVDMGTGELFAGNKSDFPPVGVNSDSELDDGRPAGARARVFSCGSCDDETKRFIGYMEIYTTGAQKVHDQIMQEAIEREKLPRAPTADEQKAIDDGLLVTVDGKAWVPENSEDAKPVLGAPATSCPSSKDLHECLP